MRNLKKFLALVLAILMVMSVAVMTGVSAADEADHTEAAQHLNSLSIMKGNENGDLMLANGVTRYQAALFFVQTLTGKTDVSVWNAEKKSAIFSDVVEYGTAIDYAYNIAIVRGRGNGVYGYNDPITYQDMLVMAVRALGYETEGMSYPYGYILAAQKLELDEDLDELVNFKAELNRGQTAEIIWNMLNTEIAVDFDGEKIYPGEKYYNKYTGNEVEPQNRKTLLEKSGFADGTIVGYITEAVLTKDDGLDEDDDPYVVFEGLEIKAADLGITVDTPKASYLGLEAKFYLDDDEAKFTQGNYDDGDISIVFADFYSYTTVENLGDAGNIKFVVDGNKETLTLGSDKFELVDKNDNDKIALTTYVLTKDGWVLGGDILGAFNYNTTDKEYDGFNTYGKVQYRTVTNDDGDVVEIVALYTPYEFSRYFSRSLKDSTTAQKANFVTVGKYGALVPAANTYDDEDTYFQEYLLGTNVKVTSDDQVVSRKNGEKAKAVKLEGESIKSGDFFFGAYNAADNILTVAMNAGAFQTGRMTATNTAKETVKISDKTYTFGFKGAANAGVPAYNENAVQDIIDTLESGKDNVKFILVDGNVVYVEATSDNADDKIFDFVVADFNGEYLEAALGLKEGKLAEKLTSGFYVKDGEVQFAVLDLAKGEWKLATLAEFDYGAYDADDDEFANEVDNVATLAKYAKITTLTGDGEADFNAVSAATAKVKLFAVVAEKNGAYTLASVAGNVKIADHDGTCIDKLAFSDDSAKSSKITSDKDVEAARVTLDANSLVILLNTETGKVGIRKGVQKEANSVNVDVTYYSATSDIIFGTLVGFDVDDWADKKATIDENATYYVVTADSSFTLDTAKDGDDTTYTVTADGLFDLRTGKVVNGITEEADKKGDLVLNKKATQAIGTVIYFDGGEDYEAVALSGNVVAAIAKANDADDNGYTALNLAKLKIEDSDTVTYTGGAIDGKTLSAADAYGISIKVTTVIAAEDLDKDYDMNNLYTDLAGDYDDVATLGDNDEYLEYALEGDTVEELPAPTEGVFDQFIIDAFVNGAHIYAPKKDEDPDFGNDDTLNVALFAAARFENGKIYIEVVRLITK